VEKLGKVFAVATLMCAAGFTAVAGQESVTPSQGQHPEQNAAAQPKTSAVPAASPANEQSPAASPAAPAPSATSLVVEYQEGTLAITAQNATLRDILDRVHESTGAVIEAPALDERVSVQLGPQTPVNVIAALLEGMQLNYAILGGGGEQHRIQRIIVTSIPAASPQPAIPIPVLEEVAAKARARALIHFAEETGGDEGVWDNGPQASTETHEPASLSSSTPAR
jgi:hypothetical protein